MKVLEDNGVEEEKYESDEKVGHSDNSANTDEIFIVWNSCKYTKDLKDESVKDIQWVRRKSVFIVNNVDSLDYAK